MLALVAIHHNAALGLELPRSLIDVENDDIHAKVHRRLLRAEARTQAIVEKYQQRGLIATQLLILESVGLNLQGLSQCHIQRSEILYASKYSHTTSTVVAPPRLERESKV